MTPKVNLTFDFDLKKNQKKKINKKKNKKNNWNTWPSLWPLRSTWLLTLP